MVTDMSVLLARLRRFYGSHPLHLLTMVGGFSLAGYIMVTFKPATLWNPQAWWQSIAVWLAGAILLHDLALFPLYALADRLLGIAAKRPGRRRRGRPRVQVRNHVRIPVLGSGLALLMFFPGIVQQGAATYMAATGQTQQSFLGRWSLLTASMFILSALLYAIRLVLAHQRTSARSAGTHSLRHICAPTNDESSAARPTLSK
jgi:hypothetical protein